MGSRDLSWASLDQTDSHISSASLQLSRESLSTSESQPVDVDLLGGDLALSDDSSGDEIDEVDSDSDSEESEEEGEVDRNMEELSCRIKELGAKLDEPLKKGWRRECLLNGEKVASTTENLFGRNTFGISGVAGLLSQPCNWFKGSEAAYDGSTQRRSISFQVNWVFLARL